MLVLAGDVGGTKTLLSICRLEAEGPRCLHQARLPSGDYPHLRELVLDYLARPEVNERLAGEHPAGACFAVAGPTTEEGGRRLTNLPWHLQPERLAADLPIARIALLNDFEATALGVTALPPAQLLTLQAASAQPGAPRLVVGAGTGLGQAILIGEPGQDEVLPSEGGHIDFAPLGEPQIALWRELLAEHGRVSVERVVSGSGLVRIAEFLAARGQPGGELAQALGSEDAAPVITRLALAGTDPVAVGAVAMFLNAYGAFVGNAALQCLPFGGIYIAGGVAGHLRERMHSEDFLRPMQDKGRMGRLIARMPVHLVLDPHVGLRGAERAAMRLAQADGAR